MPLHHVAFLVLLLGTPVFLAAALVAGSYLGCEAAHVMNWAVAPPQRAWDLGAHPGDAWGSLFGALAGVVLATLGLVMTCAYFTP